jgi:hypothetical protein
VKEEEIHFVLAIFVLKGTVQKPSVRLHLSRNQLAATPVFGSVIALDRFEIICRFLHFIDNIFNNTSEGPQNLFKIYPTIRHLNSKFQALCLPKQDMSVDKSQMVWKGILSFTQKPPLKSSQFRIKTFQPYKITFWLSVVPHRQNVE